MAETVTGTTVGDVKYVVVYLDVNTNNLYDANGQLYGNNTLATFLDNEFTLELHYVQDISTSSNPEEWAVWDGLKDLTVSSTLAFDDNYLHAVKGTIVADAEAGSPSVSVDVTDDINKDTLSRYGVLLVNPFGDEEDQLMIPYSSFQQVSGTTFSFIVDDAQGLEASVTKDSPVRVSDPLYMFINANDIYEANIPNRYEEGVFKFPVNVMSRKLLNALDYSGSTGVSGTMEHKIYANKTNVVGLKNKSFTPPLPLDRNQDIDEVASLREFVGIKTTIGGDTVYIHDVSRDTEHDEVEYYAWMNTENDTVAFYTKTLDVTVGTLLYDEMYFTQLTDTVSELVYEVNPYLFCGWNSGVLKYWTKGNDVKENDYFYNISGGTATVGTASASPVYESEPVLFRTFAFPFIVRNLVDYGVSLTIPVEDIDWTKEYIISIIRNNMEEVTGKASQGAYGVVMIANDGTIDVNDGVISIATSLATKQDNLTFAVPLNNSGNTVSLQYGDGLTVGSTGTNANKLIANEATVEETLTDARKVTVEETTTTVTTITDRVVEPHDLKGALSVGQAVDVSCPASWCSASSYYILLPDDATQYTCDSDKYKDGGYLNSFKVVYSGADTDVTIGFSSNDNKGFPKWATGLYYLYIADIKNSGQVDLSNCYFYAGSNIDIAGMSRFLPASARTKGQTTYTRIAVLTTSASCSIHFIKEANATVQIEIKNWRQYEVTALTDEAIAYIAQLDDPDTYFRSANARSIVNKYLVKQDMVCPFIPTIEMENKDLTVAAGLSYKMIYSSNTAVTRTITADTIPSNGYGWDTHLQLFIDSNTTVSFQSPLVLMDALTPNSGHNMTIKWRNGQVLAYVDDTDVGYIVTVTTGTENGSLLYGLNNDVGQYIVFNSSTNEIPISIGGSTINKVLNIIGNGSDKTLLDGYIYSKKTSYGALSITGVSCTQGITTLYAGDTTTLNINNCHISGATHYQNVTGSDNFQRCMIGPSCSVYNTIFDNMNPDGITGYWGVIALYKSANGDSAKFINCTYKNAGKQNVHLFCSNALIKDSIFIDNTVQEMSGENAYRHGVIYNISGSITIEGCLFSNNHYNGSTTRGSAVAVWVNCTISGSTFATLVDAIKVDSGATVSFAGTNIINSTISGAGSVVFADGATVTSTTGTGAITITDASAVYKIRIGSNAKISNLRVTGSTCNYGLLTTQMVENAVIEDCIITGNTAAGHLVFIVQGANSSRRVDITGCTFGSNALSASWIGDLICWSGINIHVTNCLFMPGTPSHYGLMASAQTSGDTGNAIVYITGCTFSTIPRTSRHSTHGTYSTFIFRGTNIFNKYCFNSGVITFEDGAILDAANLFDSDLIYNGDASSIISIPEGVTITIIPYGATQESEYVTISGPTTGTSLSRLGVLS